ncbi:hypothetical protein JIN85_16670 [Luteolibacter pohnpeiensis]|uniref:Uncharacterized protein n=1 Tax=Luteolibacter pohnpeiensis TaxID=454153 RepID=A0A934S9W8_9BACT|nr:hypothetical protein [Luteolibacter pohnpeiensis]MBK1884055.1 hypothetical protein [Luteolibacter pohnpeiensis]
MNLLNSPDLIPKTKWWNRALRLGLLLSAVGWGISFTFLFASWESCAEQLMGMGANFIEYDPMLDYWLRMTAAAFGGIGIASAIACIWPDSFKGLIVLLVPFHLFVGVILVGAAKVNHLQSDMHPTFIADITFCFSVALLIGVPLLVSRFLSAERQK